MRLAIENVALRYAVAAVLCFAGFVQAQTSSADGTLLLPLRISSLRLAVLGDAGRGSKDQYELAALLADYHRSFPFEAVLF